MLSGDSGNVPVTPGVVPGCLAIVALRRDIRSRTGHPRRAGLFRVLPVPCVDSAVAGWLASPQWGGLALPPIDHFRALAPGWSVRVLLSEAASLALYSRPFCNICQWSHYTLFGLVISPHGTDFGPGYGVLSSTRNGDLPRLSRVHCSP